MANKDEIAVLCHVRDVAQAPGLLQQGYRIGAGTAHISSELTGNGVKHLCLNDQVSDERLQQTLVSVADLLKNAEDEIDVSWPAALKSAVLTKLAKSLLAFHLQQALETQLGAEVLYIAGTSFERFPAVGKPVPLNSAPVNSDRPGQVSGLAEGLKQGRIWGRTYRLDFRSLSGKQARQPGDPPINIVIKPAPGKKQVSLPQLVLKAAVKSRALQPDLDVALDVPAVPAPECLSDLKLNSAEIAPDIRDFALRIAREAAIGFSSYRAAMTAFLNRNGLPEEAVFNHVRDEGLAGFAAALHEAKVECRMHSHGALMAFGDTPRHRIVEIIGAGHFNSTPAMSHLIPRSPLQVQLHCENQTVVKTVRLASPAVTASSRQQPFRIYYAPNFLPWPQNLWGISPSCFDTVECIRALSAAVAEMPATELLVRIKTTAADTATKNHFFENRALYPQDVAHVLDPGKGIIDASLGSHKVYLEKADLVVTEGLTSVMFDGLEMRKPLLLLNRSPLVTPSMPAWTAAELLERDGRNAVYSAHLGDRLPSVIDRIREKHQKSLLSDEELKHHVWV